MTPHTLPRHKWFSTFKRRGGVFDPAGPYVLSADREAGTVTLDTDHEAYPRKPDAPPAVRAASGPSEGVRRARIAAARAGGVSVDKAHAAWSWLHAAMAAPIPIQDRPAVWAKIKALADGLGLCGCRSHWRAVLKARPVDWDDPAGWAIAAHNDVRRSLSQPIVVPDPISE